MKTFKTFEVSCRRKILEMLFRGTWSKLVIRNIWADCRQHCLIRSTVETKGACCSFRALRKPIFWIKLVLGKNSKCLIDLFQNYYFVSWKSLAPCNLKKNTLGFNLIVFFSTGELTSSQSIIWTIQKKSKQGFAEKLAGWYLETCFLRFWFFWNQYSYA